MMYFLSGRKCIILTYFMEWADTHKNDEKNHNGHKKKSLDSFSGGPDGLFNNEQLC